LIDEVRIDLVPVVFGAGVRYFGDYAGSPLLLDDPQLAWRRLGGSCGEIGWVG
jgi:hypothetical protein